MAALLHQPVLGECASGMRSSATNVATRLSARVQVTGKFLTLDGRKLFVKGVTYGPFGPAESPLEFGTPEGARTDLQAIAAGGFNTLRTYTPPPRWFLDLAAELGLLVMIGLAWEQHAAVLDEWRRPGEILRRVRARVQPCAGHPAVLCFAVGNEIPAQVVRWYGRRRMERFLHRLYRTIKAEDPLALVTYVNYPTTEYLELPFLDLVAFNVYLEKPETLNAYLSRLQNQAGDRPLLMTEIGLDSRQHGEAAQATQLTSQMRSIFAAGCAGTFVFAWTDEWYRGGQMITDWSFGLTDASRRPRPALAALSDVLAELPIHPDAAWPLVTVVVCSFNGARTIRQCLQALTTLQYPRYEVIVVDDGSNDDTASIAGEFDVRLIRTANGGLSAARNVGLRSARGEIVAYIDDDAWPDEHWLNYLVHTFLTTNHVGVGGPNIPPPDDGRIAACVARSPGGPTHVLLDDRSAEHIPGCNMAFRSEALRAVGGFDSRFRVAGDDVDICWTLQEQGWTLGFSPAAVVWHRRRNTVKGYLRQQLNYGRAEADLEKKWPLKYNAVGHLTWAGRIYGPAIPTRTHWLLRPGRVYSGMWGTAPFQRIYPGSRALLTDLLTVPEYYLLVLCLMGAAFVELLWPPMFGGMLAVTVAILLPVLQAAATAWSLLRWMPQQRGSDGIGSSLFSKVRAWGSITFLHLAQPLARLRGRLDRGLTPWRLRFGMGGRFRLFFKDALWCETWRSTEERLHEIQSRLNERGAVVTVGGDFDGWDLELRAGLFGAIRMKLLCEEHGEGRQLVRVKARPGPGRLMPSLSMLAGAGVLTAMTTGPISATILCSLSMAIILSRVVYEWLTGMALAIEIVQQGAASEVVELGAETEQEFSVIPTAPAVQRQTAIVATVRRLMPRPLGMSSEAELVDRRVRSNEARDLESRNQNQDSGEFMVGTGADV